MEKGWIELVMLAVLMAGCDRSSSTATPSPLPDYEYVVEMPGFMEEKPRGKNLEYFKWIWYAKDGLTVTSHVLKRETPEVLESPQTLKAVIENQLGLVLDSEFVEPEPGQFSYEYRGEGRKGWQLIFAEKTPDERATIAIFSIYPAVTPEIQDVAEAEKVVTALKAGRFEEMKDQSRVTAEIQER